MGARVGVLVSLENIKDATNATGIRHLLHVWRVAVRVVQPALESRGIATGQMAHLAELPKPGRVESFKC